MHSLRMHHTAIVVSDLQRSLQFYDRVFGLQPTKVVDLSERGLRLAFLPVGESLIELLCYSAGTDRPSPGVTDHLAIGVDDVDSHIRHLAKLGVVSPDSQPRGGPGGSRIFFFSGPDGEKLELFEDAKGN